MKAMVKEIALEVQRAGGRAMLVGGCVRDDLLRKPVKDYDIEVYGLEPNVLKQVLEKFGKVDAVGASFAVYKLGQDIDVSIPRREKKVGIGHKGFEVTGDPYMSFADACSRRDFTINAIMKDPLSGEIIDPFGGMVDLERGVIRAASDKTFQEDSLRVLRLAQFASRLGFEMDGKTFKMALQTDLSDLPKERVWMEIEKLLLKSEAPAYGIVLMASLEIRDKLFPSLRIYSGMLAALNKAAKIVEELPVGERLSVLLAILTLRSRSEVLDELGVTSVEGYNVLKMALSLRKAYQEFEKGWLGSKYKLHKLAQITKMRLLGVLVSVFNDREVSDTFDSLVQELGISEEPVKPLITGKYLMHYGVESGKEMGKILEKLYQYQLEGCPDDTLLFLGKALAKEWHEKRAS